MSRIGKMPVQIPNGVDIKISPDNKIVVKGPKGTLDYKAPGNFKINIDNGLLVVERPGESKPEKATHGLVRTLIKNMVEGVTTGYAKKLEIIGVGYRVAKQGNGIKLIVGYSHPIVVEPEPGIEFELPDASTIVVKGIDKYMVGQTAANIRSIRPPEPYKGKGIKYSDEYIRRKVGKAGA